MLSTAQQGWACRAVFLFGFEKKVAVPLDESVLTLFWSSVD